MSNDKTIEETQKLEKELKKFFNKKAQEIMQERRNRQKHK